MKQFNYYDYLEYKTLKKLKVKVIENKEYEKYRYEIAYRFGKLLSYSDETIQNYIQNNDEKEWGFNSLSFYIQIYYLKF